MKFTAEPLKRSASIEAVFVREAVGVDRRRLDPERRADEPRRLDGLCHRLHPGIGQRPLRDDLLRQLRLGSNGRARFVGELRVLLVRTSALCRLADRDAGIGDLWCHQIEGVVEAHPAIGRGCKGSHLRRQGARRRRLGGSSSVDGLDGGACGNGRFSRYVFVGAALFKCCNDGRRKHVALVGGVVRCLRLGLGGRQQLFGKLRGARPEPARRPAGPSCWRHLDRRMRLPCHWRGRQAATAPEC